MTEGEKNMKEDVEGKMDIDSGALAHLRGEHISVGEGLAPPAKKDEAFLYQIGHGMF